MYPQGKPLRAILVCIACTAAVWARTPLDAARAVYSTGAHLPDDVIRLLIGDSDRSGVDAQGTALFPVLGQFLISDLPRCERASGFCSSGSILLASIR
jgi:hypothetical protein